MDRVDLFSSGMGEEKKREKKNCLSLIFVGGKGGRWVVLQDKSHNTMKTENQRVFFHFTP